MPKLSDVMNDTAKKARIVEECQELLDLEVGDKGGISGLAIKAGYAAVKGIKPGFIKHVLSDLLPEFARALDPLCEEADKAGKSVGTYMASNASRAANAMLAITDGKAQRSNKGVVKSTYEKLRPTAQKHVEAAMPRLSRLIDRHVA